MDKRNYTLLDKLLIQVDNSLTTLFTNVVPSRPNPAAAMQEYPLNSQEKRQSIGYMRVNHTGEVCAQALYRGQMTQSRSDQVYVTLEKAAIEETDHLAWCHDRLKELGGHRSYLNLMWYWNAFLIGIIAGIIGDRWSLGFVQETEMQVEAHLENHLNKLSKNDIKSHKIVEQMKVDEKRHGQSASEVGAAELPQIIKKLMTLQAKVMTTVAYWI